MSGVICSDCGKLNPEGNRYCGMCGGELTRQPAGRERRRVSVLFIDLVSFSTMTHGLDPEELRDLADGVLTAVAGVIEDFDGYVDAFRGDGLIALFGAPHSHPDDPQRAVLAAAKGLETIDRIGRSRGMRLQGRAGVNTGLVIAGSVGSGKVRSYTVMGSAVNLSARLEEAATPGEVWVGPETYEATRHRLLFEPTGPLDLNGFPAVKQAYRLVRTEGQPEVDPYAQLAFVGRDDELDQLADTLAKVVESGHAKELWVAGEAGRGKTRLLREFVSRAKDRITPVWLVQRPAAEFSWNPLAFQVFGLSEGQDEHAAERRVKEILDETLPGDLRTHRTILSSINLAPLKTWTRLERRRVDRTSLAWRDLMAALPLRADNGEAVLLVVEGEPRNRSLLEFLESLKDAAAPVLIVRTSRERSLPEGTEANALHLPPLSFEESLALLDEVANPALRLAADSLVRQVGGVPAYVLELGRALSITQEESFSGSLASLLQSRLDMIDLRPRRLLAQAALVGEASWEGLLLELSGSGAGDEIRSLVAENLLVKQPSSAIPDEIEYRFQSELLRNAVVRMIPYAERPQLHLRIATWLELHAPLDFAALTAEHFERGGSPDSAFDHFLTGAEQALADGNARYCYELFDRTLEQAVPSPMLVQGALASLQAAIALDD
ncbi:MAG TPA: adenylate/guanylate cyclase domain-containing protein, partial [Trueperaceae bacterium]|nr:adenylate/guanylate cyclase domain-containing protein [Trueperaceae bacterium]